MTSISVSVDLLERAVQALDVGVTLANQYAQDEVVQVYDAYNELAAVLAEHSEMEEQA